MNLRNHSHRLWLVALALAVLAGLLAPPANASGRQLSVQVHEAFEIGGQFFEAGELTLREVREFNPSATLTEVRVDGRSLGVMLAKHQAGPASTRPDEVIFERSRSGHLVLNSIALEGEPVRRLQVLGQGKDSDRRQATARAEPTRLAKLK